MNIDKIAKKLVREAYSPMRKNDTDSRNTSWYDMVTTYAPNLSKNCRNFVANKYEVRPNEIKLQQTHYLMYRDEKNNNNKFHYYALYYLPQGNYVCVNCSGRIGFIERTFDLTKKMFPNEMCDEYQALKAMNNHMRSKLNKGYNPIRLRSGSVNKKYNDILQKISNAYEILVESIHDFKWQMDRKENADKSIQRKLEESSQKLEEAMQLLTLRIKDEIHNA